MNKKLRADSLESRLRAAGQPQAIEALDRWLFDEGVRLSDCVSRLQSEFSFKTSLASLSLFGQRRRAERAVSRISNSKEAAATILALGRAEQIDEATLNLVAQQTFDLAVGERPDPETLVSLMGLLLKKRGQDLDREKFALLKQKAEQADAAKGITENKELSEAEKAARMRELFGVT